MVKTAVLVSGGGLNLQSLLDARVFGEIEHCELTAVISSNPDAYALRRAELAGIPTFVVERNIFPNATSFGFALLDKLRDLDIELVVLAGFDCELTQPINKHYAGRIISTYPSLLPAFADCGDVALLPARQLEAGVKITGATAFFSVEGCSSVPIILQKAVAVRKGDTPAALGRRILEEGENFVLPRAVDLYCRGMQRVEGNIVLVEEDADYCMEIRQSK